MRLRLAEFDGKATTLLGEARAAFGSEDGYIDALIVLAGDQDWPVSAGATWLLKYDLERGATLSEAATAKLIATLGDLRHWSALLHLCQSVRHLRPDETQASVMARWLAPLCAHERPFVRAWALDAVVSLGDRFEPLAPQAQAALAAAGEDRAASVRARARKLTEQRASTGSGR